MDELRGTATSIDWDTLDWYESKMQELYRLRKAAYAVLSWSEGQSSPVARELFADLKAVLEG